MRWIVSKGWHGWLLLLLVVVVFDLAAAILGGEAMTDVARRWYDNSVARWFMLAVMVFLAVHLTVLPQRVDPLDKAFGWIRERTNQPHFDMPTEDFIRAHTAAAASEETGSGDVPAGTTPGCRASNPTRCSKR